MIEKTDNPNLAILELAVEALGALSDSLVFVGGCVTGLLVTRIRIHQIRATKDVDVITRVATIVEYHGVEEQLTAQGFKPDTSPDAPICRWLKAGITLDVMPSEPGVLSFHNRWYPLAVATAQRVRLPSGREIKLINAPTFIATKLEAFKGRGMGDFLMSHDIEDIVTIVDGRPALVQEIRSAARELQNYLAEEIGALVRNPEFLDSLAGHLPGDAGSQARLPALIAQFSELTR